VIPIEASAIGHEEGGFVIDTAVKVDAALVAGATIGCASGCKVEWATNTVRIAESGGIFHITDRPDAQQVLAQVPTIASHIGITKAVNAAGQVHKFAEYIRQ